MDNGQLLVVLLALLVGAVLMALLQLRATLRRTQVLVVASSLRFDHALEEVTQAATRINHLAASIDDGVQRGRNLMTATGELAGSLRALSDKVGGAMVIGAAVGPALAAAVRVLRAPRRHPAIAKRGGNGTHVIQEQ